MSGNASRKYKKYMLDQKRKLYFGDIAARDESGRLDLVAYAASHGSITTSSPKHDLSKIPVKTKMRNLKAL